MGCKLLVLCGSTYLQRLWCLVEIFVFLEMGGDRSNLNVMLVDEAKASAHLHESVLASAIESFDPKHATCTSKYDTFRLQAVLESSGKGSEGIKNFVREVFNDASVLRQCSRSRELPDETDEPIRSLEAFNLAWTGASIVSLE